MEELEAQEFFVPLKNIGKVQKNALADATAMAKTKVRSTALLSFESP